MTDIELGNEINTASIMLFELLVCDAGLEISLLVHKIRNSFMRALITLIEALEMLLQSGGQRCAVYTCLAAICWLTDEHTHTLLALVLQCGWKPQVVTE